MRGEPSAEEEPGIAPRRRGLALPLRHDGYRAKLGAVIESYYKFRQKQASPRTRMYSANGHTRQPRGHTQVTMCHTGHTLTHTDSEATRQSTQRGRPSHITPQREAGRGVQYLSNSTISHHREPSFSVWRTVSTETVPRPAMQAFAKYLKKSARPEQWLSARPSETK